MITVTVLGKRTLDEDLDILWDGLWHYENVWGNRNPAAVHPQGLAEMHVPLQSPADTILGSMDSHSTISTLTSPADTILGSTDSHSTISFTSLANSDRESMELDGDAPPESPGSGHSDSPPTSQEWSTESDDWYTAPSSLGSSTESDSDRWSTISNAPSAESQTENLKAADYELKGKAKVSRRISGTTSGVHTVNAAQMELRTAVDPGQSVSASSLRLLPTNPSAE